ncbi:MAG: calcium/sodium antiporter [Oscillospiraceae bacterium]|nr:calcium/sodium antiporter [Oscillospiraceae bacterium]
MQLLLNAVLLIAGFVLLIKGADAFVDGASEVSRRLKIPPVIVGLTIVAFGTSLPEFAVSLSAAFSGSNGIAAGNVVGSNIFNSLIVVGFSAMFVRLPVSSSIIKKDYPFMAAITLVLLCVFFDGSMSRANGLILVVFFIFFLTYTVRGALKARSGANDEPSGEGISTLKCLLSIVLGAAGIIVGGDMVVDNASVLAVALGMSDTLVGLTIVSVGTSLPELVTSLVAAKKGENDISIGNVVGSNIFNICFVLGLSTSIHPINISPEIVIDTAILLAITVLMAIPVFRKKIGRIDGGAMVLAYAAYLAYIIMRNYGVMTV